MENNATGEALPLHRRLGNLSSRSQPMRIQFISSALLAALLSIPLAARADITVVKTETTQLDLGGMIQVLGLAQELDDPYKRNDRVYLFMPVARLRVNGHYQGVGFYSELALGGSDAVNAITGVSLSLLDFAFTIPLFSSRNTYLKVGQFKVPYGREQLTYEANRQFGDSSIENLGFLVGRDVGLALISTPGPLTLIGGVFTGGGRDVPPQHYLPEKIGVPLFVARVGFGDVDVDPFFLHQDEQGSTDRHLKAALFANALYTKDSLIGHSSVLNVKLADKSLLLNSNWNPYIAKGPLDQGVWYELGTDAAVRAPMGPFDLSAEAEVNFAKYTNKYGTVQMWGTRAQVGALYQDFELSLRWAVLGPDSHFASAATANGPSVTLTGTQPIQELTPSLTWFIYGQNLKLIADLPILIDDPVFTEKNVGAYVGTELPDETSVLASGGTVARQTIVEGRLMLQAQF
jgi:hypothetical protein